MLALGALWPGPRGIVPALAAQEPGEAVRVTLHLLDAENSGVLMGALVRLSGDARPYVTGVDGQVTLEIPPGSYTLTAHKGGYATMRGDFRVRYGGDLKVAMNRLGEVDASIPGRLLVRVAEFGSGRLIEGAAVSLAGGPSRMTDGEGWVEFGGVSGPVAEVTARSFGYEERTDSLSLREGRTTVVEIGMAIDAVVLAPIEVEVQSGFLEKQGVYWRIDRGWPDRLLSRDDLIERAKPRLADAFRHIPGVRVDYPKGLAVLMTHMGCHIPVFLDARPLSLGNPAGTNIDDILPEEVEVAEFYDPGRVPARFGGTNPDNCGVLLLWSRQRAGKGGRQQ